MNHGGRKSPKVVHVLVVFGLAGLFAGCAGRRADSRPPASGSELAKVAEAYKISIVSEAPHFPVETSYGAITGQGADADELENYTGLFAREFNLYPPDFVKQSQLKRVVLCKELSFSGQRRNAIPDFE